MSSLQEIFDHWKTLLPSKRNNLLQNGQFLIDLGKLAKLQDGETGDTLLHIVLRQLNAEAVNLNSPSYQLLSKLCLTPVCFGNMFLQNKAKETPYDLYILNNTINSKFFIKKGRERYNANDPSDVSHTFNKVAKGELPAGIMRETLIREEYQPGNHTKPISMLQAAALNGHGEFFSETHISFKIQKDGPVAEEERDQVMGMALGISAAVAIAALTNMNINQEAVNAQFEQATKQHPIYAHSNPVLRLFNIRGKTYTVQEIFRQQKRELIQQALAKYNEANHGNGIQIGNNGIAQYEATYQALFKLVRDRNSSSSKIIRKPLKPYDPRGWIRDDADTESYQLIRNALHAYESTDSEETLRCLRRLAVYAGLSEDYFDKETITERTLFVMNQ